MTARLLAMLSIATVALLVPPGSAGAQGCNPNPYADEYRAFIADVVLNVAANDAELQRAVDAVRAGQLTSATYEESMVDAALAFGYAWDCGTQTFVHGAPGSQLPPATSPGTTPTPSSPTVPSSSSPSSSSSSSSSTSSTQARSSTTITRKATGSTRGHATRGRSDDGSSSSPIVPIVFGAIALGGIGLIVAALRRRS